jgi:opacity protein-like surface antigen
MKQFFLIVLLVAGIAVMGSAQGYRVNAYSAYTFNDHVDSHYSSSDFYDATITGGYQFGAGIEYMARPNIGVELKYLRQNTTAPMLSSNMNSFNLGMNYLLFGINKYFKTANKKIEPYAGAALGLDLMDIKNSYYSYQSNATKFVWNVKAGTNYWLTKRIGIKLEANLISAVQAASNDFLFGSNVFGLPSSTSYKSIFQFGVGGGLTYKLGRVK